MLKIFVQIFLFLYLVVSFIFVFYLSKDTPPFPGNPPDALVSKEPADIEYEYRKAYFTDYTREQVIEHYQTQISFLPTIRLNYPPEEAQTIIRDQTRSSYLEELTHPMRTSIYINGFQPRVEKDEININGEHFEQKITIRYVQSNRYIRTILGVIICVFGFLLIKEYFNFLKNLTLPKNIWSK